jgi:DNA-binding LacI/PurR family transcriptional regulator
VISFDLSAHGNARTLEAFARAAQEAGYSVNVVGVTAQTEEAVRQAFTHLANQPVDGVVFVESQILDTSTLHLPSGVPVVIADGDAGQRYAAVQFDQVAGARIATEHLLGLGHRTVWHVAGPQDSYSARLRAATWHTTLKEAGASVPPVQFGDWTADSGYAIGRRLAPHEDVTAIFSANDQMALGLIKALEEGGRPVPGDVSIVGFDNFRESAFFRPPLTTIHQDFEEIGHQCVALLLEQIAHGRNTAGFRATIRPELIVRASTGPLRGSPPRRGE